MKLPFIPDDPRIVDSTGALDLTSVPKRMLVIGGGIIGLEMATVYSTLGTRIEVVEMLEGLTTGADRDLVKVWQKYNEKRFDRLMLKTRSVGVEAKADGILVTFEGEQAPPEPQLYDLVLLSVGRSPNGKMTAPIMRRHRPPLLHRGRSANAYQRCRTSLRRRHRQQPDARAQAGTNACAAKRRRARRAILTRA